MIKKSSMLIVVVLIFLAGCSKSSVETGYKLIYIDNDGKCMPCIQMRKISEDVISERFAEIKDSINLQFERVSIRDVRYEDLRNKSRAYVKSLVLSEVQNGKEIRFKLIDTGVIFLSINKPEFCKDLIEKEIEDFLKNQ